MPVFPVLEPTEAAKPALPTVDQILAKYVAALGGEAAIRKVTSRMITGTQFIPTGPGGTVPTPAAVERYQKAPNLAVTIYRAPAYAISQGFDGTAAWSQDQAGRVTEPVTLDVARAARAADFYEPLNLKRQYATDRPFAASRESTAATRISSSAFRRETNPNRCTSTRRPACCCGSRRCCRRRLATARTRRISTTTATRQRREVSVSDSHEPCHTRGRNWRRTPRCASRRSRTTSRSTTRSSPSRLEDIVRSL